MYKMLRPQPRLLRIWEVVSVIQDLPYDSQLEIIDKLEVTSVALNSDRSRANFLLSDEDLVTAILNMRSQLVVSETQREDLTQLTRLSLLYVINMPLIRGETLWSEFNEYFGVLPFETQIKLSTVVRPSLISREMVGVVADRAVDLSLAGVHQLLDASPSYSTFIFRHALNRGKTEIVDYLIDHATNVDTIIEYAYQVLERAITNNLPELAERYSIISGGGYLSDNLFAYWNPDSEESIRKVTIRANMIHSIIDYNHSIEDLMWNLREDYRLIAEFALRMPKDYDWTPYIDTPIINSIFNDQV